MSCATPVRTSLRTQRASESKRALFQQPIVAMETSHHRDSTDSCDLGILSTIDTDSSDIDQFVPVTPNSWRPTSRSMRSSDRKKTVKEILKSPLTFRNYSSRHGSQSSISSRLTDFLADTESCSSSLKDLTFHSDSDLSDVTGKTPDRRISKATRRYPLRNYDIKNKENNNGGAQSGIKKALKSLNFEQVIDFTLPDEIMSSGSKKTNKSPLKMLKTPHENVTTVKTPPRIHHKSLKDLEKNAESDEKHLRPNSANAPAPKARLSLFGSGQIKLSPKSFYPKSVANSVSDISKLHNTTWPSKHVKNHKSSSFSHKRNKKRIFGEINKGVWHGIQKPKPKAVTKEKALNLALKIIENSKLNDYIDKFMQSKNKPDSNENNTATAEDLPRTGGVSEIDRDIQQVNQTLKQFGCDMSIETLVNNVTKVNELTTAFQVNKPIDLKKSLAPPKPVFDLSRSLISNRSYDLNQSFDSLNRSTDLNMSFTESEMTYDDNESVMSDFDNASTSKKIFKARTTESRKAVIKMRNLKLEVDNGKIHLPSKKQHVANDGVRQIWNALENKIVASTPIIQLDASDLLTADDDEESFRIPGMSAIDNLLSQWKEEEVPRSEPQMQFITNTNATMQNNFTNMTNTLQLSAANTTNFINTTLVQNDTKTVQNNFIETNAINVGASTSGVQTNEVNITNSTNQRIANTYSSNSSSPVKSDDASSDNGSVVNSQPNSAMDQADVTTNDKKRKMYPIFDKDLVKAKQAKYEENSNPTACTKSSPLIYKYKCTDRNQYIIDAGQKNFGVTQCGECGVIYHIGDLEDERDHMIHHTGLNVLKFKGWKVERECGRWGQGRVIVVQAGDPPPHWRKVADLLERVVHPQLGYAPSLAYHQDYKVYLYIENKQIIGCLVAEPVYQAFKMLPGEDCISIEAYSVKCGISRLWTHKNNRRQNIATRMVDCLRANFLHGHILAICEISFSTPTIAGRAFAQKYTKKEDFYVYIEAPTII